MGSWRVGGIWGAPPCAIRRTQSGGAALRRAERGAGGAPPARAPRARPPFRRATRARFIFRSVLALVVLLLPPLAAAASPTAQEVDGAQRFGVVEAYYRPDDARELGVGWERIIFDWAQFQPHSPLQFNTDAVPEAWLQEAHDAGREVVGLLKSTPRWASDGTLPGLPPHGLDYPIDDPRNYWAAFVRKVVGYYGERWGITHWIVLNEPDLRPGEIAWYEFDGGVPEYYQMLKVAYLAAKQANPEAVIHLAGMAWWTDVAAGRPPYLERLLAYAARDPQAYEHGFFFDVVTVHGYFKTRDFWNMLMQVRGVLWHYGLQEKPLWVGECNARPSRDPLAELPDDPPYAVTLAQQADFIVQAAALSLAAGVERFAVYRLYDDHYTPRETEPWGLVRADGSRRPAFGAYRTVIREFAATQRAFYRWSDHAALVVLQQPERTLYVLWARRAVPVTFYVRAHGYGERGTRLDVYGVARPVRAQRIYGEAAGAWFVERVAAATPQPDGTLAVEGRPILLALEGPPRAVWVEVNGAVWGMY